MYITPLRSESPFPRGHEIYSLIEGFLVYIIQFFFQMSRLRDSLKKIFEKMVKFRQFWPCSKDPCGAIVMQFTIYVPLTLKMHLIWPCSFQEVKINQLLTYDG